MGTHKIQENIKLEHAILPTQATENDSYVGTGVSMANYGLYSTVVQVGTGMDSDIEVALVQSTDDTNYTAFIPAKTGTITSDTESGILILEARDEEMSALNTHIRVEATVTTGATTFIGALNIRTKCRYAQATLPA